MIMKEFSSEEQVVMITGVRGMDGSTLTDKYLAKGWKVIGIDHWEPTSSYPNLELAFNNPNFTFETGDICEKEFIKNLFDKYKPSIFYNMAAISLVPESFKIPVRIFEVNTLALLNILEIIRYYYPKTRIYQASSSEQIGSNTEEPQTIHSNMLPTSPYAVAKLASYHLIRVYRDAYKLFAVNGMLWNHEGPRRGPMFVTRKISKHVAKWSRGHQSILELGNIYAYRDWGLSSDFCDAMILMMEADSPDDYAVNTGEAHTIKEFVDEAFRVVGIELKWYEDKDDPTKTYANLPYYPFSEVVKINLKFYRPSEVPVLHGDYSETKEKLGWEPKTKFKELVEIMVLSDIEREKNGKND
jgi:GDPmannose 4,6-dehydratase